MICSILLDGGKKTPTLMVRSRIYKIWDSKLLIAGLVWPMVDLSGLVWTSPTLSGLVR
jgi:hypothetical protein